MPQIITNNKNCAISGNESNQGVRPCREDDIPELVHLLVNLFPRSAKDSANTKEAILKELLFNYPWEDARMPSLVYEDKTGKLTGFLGVTERKMSIRGEPIRAAISYNLMVDPECRSTLAGMQLLKTFLSGSQDLSIADSATATSRKLWERLGGDTIPLYSIYWKHPVRPMCFAANYLKKQPYVGPFFRFMMPVFRLTDRLLSPMLSGFGSEEKLSLYTKEISVETLKNYIDQFSNDKLLVPVYDSEMLRWVLNLATMPNRFGELRKEAVLDDNDKLLGWFVYYENPGGTNEILQVKALPGNRKEVLQMLFKKAWAQGSVEVAGRLEPDWMHVLSESFCFYTPGRMWMLVHSGNREIIRAFKSGDTFITRLEGDMWLL